MSGITGIYFVDGRPVDASRLERMVNVLSHRGPDGIGMWSEGPVGFGHRMLWTTPESRRETLPLVSQCDGLVITADARIDNREELADLLDINNNQLELLSDSALILAAYERWGEDSPEKLLGDFAFVIWDRRKRELFAARDFFGTKPFYYYFGGGTFAFASEIKSIFRSGVVARIVNEVRVADFLSASGPEGDDCTITCYRGV